MNQKPAGFVHDSDGSSAVEHAIIIVVIIVTLVGVLITMGVSIPGIAGSG